MKVEYRVKQSTRFTVTRYVDNGETGDCREIGEYPNGEVAYNVAYALCKKEHEDLGYPIDDERIQYPQPLDFAAEAA